MKTVTENFLVAQKRPDVRVKRTVQYKRRYWDPTANEYTWESSWSDLRNDRLSTVSPVNWQLDSDTLNEFKVSNVTLVIDNSDGYLVFENTSGFFSQDSASPIYGYEPYWTKFRVRMGYELSDGTTEQVTLFTGLATEYIMDSDQKTCQLILQGLEITLLNTKADGIATFVVEENLGTGDGSETEFATLNPGVGGVSLVSVGGLTNIDGEDYSISQLNEASLGAKLTFVDPPDLGDDVLASYFYWPQGYQFHEIVEALLDAGGVASGDQFVDPVIFGNSVINSRNFSSQSEWDSGTKVNMETVLYPGDLKIDYADTDIANDNGWTTSTSGWINGSVTTDGTYIYGAAANREYNQKTGVWGYTFKLGNASQSQNLNFSIVPSLYDGGVLNGYIVSIKVLNPSNLIYIHKVVAGIVSNLASTSFTPDTSDHDVVFSRDPNGLLRVYYDTTLIMSVTDTLYDAFVGIHVLTQGATPSKIKEIIVTEDYTASWTSPAIDWGSVPSSWSAVNLDALDSGEGRLVIQTRSSTNGIAWDSWLDISESNFPQSDLKRYLQIRSNISNDGDSGFDPHIQALTVASVSASVTITLPALSGTNIYEAIKILAEFCNYEFGFTPDEDFFFRPKSSDDPVMDLTQSDYVSRISGMSSGYENVYGTVRATYGEITREKTDSGLFAESPKAKVLDRVYEISADTNIQIPPTADIATGVAQGLYAYLSKRRRRMKLTTKMIPQLDLSDSISLTLINNTPKKLWWLGDPQIDLGDKDVFLWGAYQQLAYEMQAKIISARYDVENYNCEFELEEIVS